jgi:organic radical activating enzyme
MPFYGAEYQYNNYISPCCLMTPHDINAVRKDMLNGVKSNSCSACWKLEEKGLKSDRQSKNESFDFYADVDINKVFDNCKNGQFSPQIIKLYTSNLCNSACVTCGPNLSTHWQSVIGMPIQLNTISDTVLNNIDFANIKMLSVLGGEPLYDKNIFNILQRLIDQNNTNCFISFVTNGNVKLTDSQINLLAKFKNSDICVSIDGIGPVYEYMRYPLKWEDLKTNIKQFKQIAKYVSVSYTLSNVNILYYDETVSWFKENELIFNHNLVTKPVYFNINALPESAKKQYPSLSHLFRTHNEQDTMLYKIAVDELAKQDRLKNTSAALSIPKFINLN